MVSGAASVRLPIPGTGQRRTARADAVVTGAGSGIGRAFALEIARRGGRVVCADIDDVAATETAECARVSALLRAAEEDGQLRRRRRRAVARPY